ncbi:MAG: STY0301 family protein [Polyangia bacterium]
MMISSLPISSWAADDMLCPGMVAVQQTTSMAYEGFTVSFRSSKYRLKAINFYEGHPSRLFVLKFDEQTERRKHGNSPKENWSALWRFQSIGPDGIWFVCEYEDTTMILTRQVPSASSQCEISYETTSAARTAYPVIKSSRCK